MTNGCPEAAIEIMPIHDHQISNRIHSNQMADGIPRLIRISIRFDKTNKVITRSSKMRRYDKNMSRIDLSLSAVIVISEMIRIFAVHVA